MSLKDNGKAILQDIEYIETENGLNLIKGNTTIKLANFTINFEELLIKSDGIDETMTFVFSGILSNAKVLPKIYILAKNFSNMSWLLENWPEARICVR